MSQLMSLQVSSVQKHCRRDHALRHTSPNELACPVMATYQIVNSLCGHPMLKKSSTPITPIPSVSKLSDSQTRMTGESRGLRMMLGVRLTCMASSAALARSPSSVLLPPISWRPQTTWPAAAALCAFSRAADCRLPCVFKYPAATMIAFLASPRHYIKAALILHTILCIGLTLHLDSSLLMQPTCLTELFIVVQAWAGTGVCDMREITPGP